MTTPTHLLTTRQACERLDGISRSTLIRWVDAGRIIPATRLPGHTGAYLFYPSEVARAHATWCQPGDLS